MDDLAFVLGRNASEGSLDHFLTVWKRAFVMGVIAAPHQDICAGVVQQAQSNGIIAEGDGTLVAKELAGLHLQFWAHPHVFFLDLLVHDIQQPGKPPRTTLNHNEFQVGVRRQNIWDA